MNRWGLFVCASLMALCGCSVPSLEELSGERSLLVAVSYPETFRKGCLKVLAQGKDATGSSTEMKLANPGSRASPWRPALLRGAEWSEDVEVTVTAHEQHCDGAVVDRQVVSLVSGDSLERTVSLVIVDEDFDGFMSSGRGGTDCVDSNVEINPSAQDVCDEVDNNCDGVKDEGYDKKWYLDADGDGVPREAGPVTACTAPDSRYKNYNADGPFDCKDEGADAARTYPGNTERCDAVDSDCDGTPDNGFESLGEACNAECGGVKVCSVDELTVVCNQVPGRMFYPDRDGDGQGDAAATAVVKCGTAPGDPGTVENNNDCDDLDPAARLGLAEVCDAIDNDCDGVVDNGLTCGGTLKQVSSHHLGGNSHDWRTVAVHPNGYPVWIAGMNGKLAVRRSAEAKFESFSFGDPASPAPTDGSPPVRSNNCGNNHWTQSWVRPSDSVVFLAGEIGVLAVHTGALVYTCAPGGLPTGESITGMVGFESAGVTILYLGDTSGRLYRWVVDGTPAFTLINDNTLNYYGLHALSPEFVLAVGGGTGGSSGQKFVSYGVPSGSSTVAPTPHTSSPNNVSGFVRSVWMGGEETACAVGDNGAVWKWNGETNWSRVAAPAGMTGTFSSVVMLPEAQNPRSGDCYMVDSTGMLRRLTRYGWAKRPALPAVNVPLHDIDVKPDGTEFWIVGDDGRVFHYPEL